MQKSVFKKALAFVLSFALLLTAFGGALAVFAEDLGEGEVVHDYVGDSKWGFNTRSENGENNGYPTIHEVPVLDNPANLDWQEGLMYWTSKADRSGDAGSQAQIMEMETYNYVGFRVNGQQYDGISTPWFKFSSLEDGTKVAFFMEYSVNENLPDTIWNTFHTEEPVGFGLIENGTGYVVGSNYGPDCYSTAHHGKWVRRMLGSFTVKADATYRVQIQDQIPNDSEENTARADLAELLGAEPVVGFRNLRAYIDNGDSTYTDIVTGERVYEDGQPFAGTEADGIIATNENFVAGSGALDHSSYKYGILDSFEDYYDFSNGFKGYSIRYNGEHADIDRVSDLAKVNEDGALEITAHPYDYSGFVTVPFRIKGLANGDQILAGVKFKGGKAYREIRFYEGLWNKLIHFGDGACPDDWSYSLSHEPITVTTADSYFWFEIQNNGDNVGFQVDELVLLKKIDDKIYQNLFNGEFVYKDGTPVGGTYADGWDAGKTNNQVVNVGPFDGVQNGDFSDGLKFWGARNGTKGSDYVTLQTEGDNVYVSHSASSATASWEGLCSTIFTLPDTKAGDKLVLIYKYKNGNALDYQAFFRPMNPSGSDWQYGNYGSRILEAPVGDGWGYAASNGYVVVGSELYTQTYELGWFAYMDAKINQAPGYVIEVSNSTAGATIDLDDFQVVRYINDYTFETFDGEIIKFAPEWAGTFENGINGNTHKYNTDYGVANGDFEDGLKYWGARNGGSYASDNATLVTDGDNHYLQLSLETNPGWCGITGSVISIPAEKLAVGDYVAMKFDLYVPDGSENNVQMVLAGFNMNVVNPDGGISEIRLSQCRLSECTIVEEKGNGWKTVITKFNNPIAAASAATGTVKAGDWEMKISIELADTNVSAAAFDNFELVKKTGEYSAAALDDGEIFKFDPVWAGTFQVGMTTSTYGKVNPEYGSINGDFSMGFKYWTATGDSSQGAGRYADLVTENGNTYVKFDGEVLDGYRGIIGSGYRVPADKLTEGDSVLVKFDVYDPDNNANGLQVKYEPYWDYGFTGSSNTDFANCILVDEKADGWKTYITRYVNPIVGTSTGPNGDWCFYISVQVIANCGSTAGVDNIELVKKVGEYAVQTLDDDEIIKFDPEWAGTFENGINGNYYNKYNPEYGVANGDFQDGLKYWAAHNYAGNYASDSVELVKDGDNYYVQLLGKVTTDWYGIDSAMISVPAEKLMVGDYVALKFDVYVPDGSEDNVQMLLVGHNMNVPDANNNNYVPELRLSMCKLSECKLIEDKGNGWKTVVSKFSNAILVESTATNTIKDGDWQFSIAIECVGSDYDSANGTWITERTSTAAFDNFEIVTKERGFGAEGGVITDLDGNAAEAVVAGDANLDGKVDLVDLVRAKKYVLSKASDIAMVSPVSEASVNVDGVAGIGAADIAAIINKILGIVA